MVKKRTKIRKKNKTRLERDINKKNIVGETPLDRAYFYNRSPIKQEIIALIRSKGGKANYHDATGRWVGDGNGDLNH